MMLLNRYKKYSSFENALVLSFILILVAVLLGYYKRYEHIIKSRAANEELYHINTAIVLYTVSNGKFPDDLKALTKANLLVQGKETFINRKYIEGIFLDKEGYPIDPWGRRYKYDKNRGLAYLNGN